MINRLKKEIEDQINSREDTLDWEHEDCVRYLLKPLAIKSRPGKGMSPVLIAKDVIDILQKTRIAFAKSKGYSTENPDSSDHPTALVFLLGQKGNVISKMELLGTSNYGCGYMPDVHSDVISESMYKLIKQKCFVAGIARVSLVHTVSTNEDGVSFGNGLNDLLRGTSEQGMVFISMCRGGFTVQMPSKNKDCYVRYGYKIM